VLHPQEVSLLQQLVRAGRLTQEAARAFAQSLEQRRAAGERPNLIEALVARRIATAEEIARVTRPSERLAPTIGSAPVRGGGHAPTQPHFPVPDQEESPTIRVGPAPLGTDTPPTDRDNFIRVPGESTPPQQPTGPRSLPYDSSGPGPPRALAGVPGNDPFQSVAPRPPQPAWPGSGSGSTPPSFGTSPGFVAPSFGPQPFGTMPGAGFPPASQGFPGPSQENQAGAAGAYALEAKIGEGSIAEVYRARHSQQRRLVALKVFRPNGAPGGAASPAELERLLDGARAAARIRHPNIVAVHEVGRLPDGRAFIAMDHVDGPSLSATIETRALGAAEVARIGSKIAAALQAAHEQAILHGDVKPANVLLDERSEPFIGDFGLAREVTDDSDLELHVRGTPAYVAPEQGSKKAPGLTAACDVYSLGATLYECLTRRPPFVADTPAATVKLARAKKPVKPRKVEPTVPHELEAVVLRALDKTPERRYPHAGDLGEDLRRFLDGRPLEAVASGGRGGVVLAALVVLVLVLGALVAVLLARRFAAEKRVKELQEVLERGDYGDLEARARLLVSERPDDSRGHRFVALALEGQHKLADALDEAGKAVELAPDSTDELLVLASIATDAEKPEGARTAYEKILAKKSLPPATEARALAGQAALEATADPAAAKAKAEKAIELAPENPDVLAAAGRALLNAQEPQAALQALDKALLARPKDENILTAHAAARAAGGDSTGALSDIDAALASRPDHVPALVLRSKLRLAAGDNTNALEDANKAKEADPSSRDAHLVMALALAWLSRLDDAETHVLELMKLAPTAATSSIARAQVSLARGRLDEALAALPPATAAPVAPARPDSLLVTALRILILKASLRNDEARGEADTLVRLAASPDARWLPPAEDGGIVDAYKRHYGLSSPDATGRTLKAEILAGAGQGTEAKAEVDAAGRDKSPPPRLALAKAMVAFLSRQQAEALRILDAGVTACPELVELRLMRAQVLLGSNPAKAGTDAEAAVRIEPNNFLARALRGQIHAAQNDRTALSDLDKADSLAPRPMPDICAQRARLLMAERRIPEARRAADKGIGVNPNHTECLFYRGLARYLVNDPGWDEDVSRALSTPDGQGRPDIRLTRLQLLTSRGRAAEAERDATDLLTQIEPQAAKSQQMQQLKFQALLARASARVFVPDHARGALEDVNAVLAVAPNALDFLAIRAFALSALDQAGWDDDVKKLAAAPPQVQTLVAQRAKQALELKVPGGWPAHLTLMSTLATQPEIRVECALIVALAAEQRGLWTDVEIWAKRVLELTGDKNDQAKALLAKAQQQNH
jgi:tetratricopeptide (TPR) repeat protein